MTNIYDVISKMHIKATANVEKAVKEDLKKEDPPVEQAKSVLERQDVTEETEPRSESANENTEGNDKKRSSQDNK